MKVFAWITVVFGLAVLPNQTTLAQECGETHDPMFDMVTCTPLAGTAPFYIDISGMALNACPEQVTFWVKVIVTGGGNYTDTVPYEAYPDSKSFSFTHLMQNSGQQTVRAYILLPGASQWDIREWTVTVAPPGTPVLERTWGKIKALYH